MKRFSFKKQDWNWQELKAIETTGVVSADASVHVGGAAGEYETRTHFSVLACLCM